MEKVFNYDSLEKQWYSAWEKSGAFAGAIEESGEAKENRANTAGDDIFSLVIPPPNVTGRLHMGHALNNTIQDLLCRFYRMQGNDVLWVPGTDHAGIATQSVVKKNLDSKGIDYRELGREQFVKKVFEWKEKYGNYILSQIKSLGASCDWERTRFTMDEKLSRAVRYAFCRLHSEGLVYQGERIVNWCPVDRTALSDDEVETAEGGEPGFLYSIAYKLPGGSGELVVSTTRPETLFGDVALAVNPSDDRYKKYIGAKVCLPLTNRTLTVLADEAVEKNFGTGVLKITPAHDKVDFEIGKRHNLKPLNVMHEDARLNNAAGKNFAGLTREQARKKVLATLEEEGLLRGKIARNIPLGRSYRSKAVIEYRLSRQWFVRMKPLAEKVLRKMDGLTFYPASFEKTFRYWLENIEDWCISRQIWWGHRIPVWKNIKNGEILTSETTPLEVLAAPNEWQQETDVLDTWFSSALFPLSAFGWPEKTTDFSRYFPTNLLSTAKDIIFFWVARMCMFSLYFEKILPFRHVLIHPTITDHHGKTMSKSKGNGIDPQVVISGATLQQLKLPIEEASPSNGKAMLKEIESRFPSGFEGVGCDALRYTLLHLLSSSQLVQLQMSDFNEIGRRFVTKLWNASFFAVAKVEDYLQNNSVSDSFVTGERLQNFFENCTEVSFIIHRLEDAQEKLEGSLKSYSLATVSSPIYHLVWNDFCDWHIELTKARLQQLDVFSSNKENTPEKEEAVYLLISLLHVLKSVVVLLHPALPFITEEINKILHPLFEKFSLKMDDIMLISSEYKISSFKFPTSNGVLPHPAVRQRGNIANAHKESKKMELLKFIVSAVRSPRKRFNIAFKLPLQVFFPFHLKEEIGSRLRALIEKMTNAELVFVEDDLLQKQINSPTSVSSSHSDHVAVVQLGEHLNVEKEIVRLLRVEKKIEAQLAPLRLRLQSKGFLEKAKQQTVHAAKEECVAMEKQLSQLHTDLADLQKSG